MTRWAVTAWVARVSFHYLLRLGAVFLYRGLDR